MSIRATNKAKLLAYVAIVIFAFGTILTFVFQSPWPLGTAFIVAGILLFLLKKNISASNAQSKAKNSDDSTKQSTVTEAEKKKMAQEAEQIARYDQAEQVLLDTNILFADHCTADANGKVLLEHKKKLEQIIDSLRNLLRELSISYPGEELTFEMYLLATKHFPALIEKFCALDERGQQSESFGSSLDEIIQEVTDIQEIVSNSKVSDFDIKAKTIRMKYGLDL